MKPAPDLRRRELAMIHIARAQLGMADDSYRALLKTIARVESAADLDWAGRQRVLEHFKACGAQLGSHSKNEWSWIDAAPPSRRPMLRKIIVQCKQLGIRRGGQVRYVEGLAKNLDGVIRRWKDAKELDPVPAKIEKPLRLCDDFELHRIVQALEMHVQRRAANPERRGG